MKNKFIPIFIILFVLFLSCKNDSNKDKFILQKSLQFKDKTTAINLVYNQLYEDSNNLALYDTLASLYYQSNNCASCVEVLNHKFKFSVVEKQLLMAYDCAVKTNNQDLEIFYLEDLSQNSADSIEWKYKLASKLYSIDKVNESMIIYEKLIGNPVSKSKFTKFQYDGKEHEISIYAASLNSLGIILVKLNFKKEAIAMFREALGHNPNFKIAANNIAFLQEE